MKKPYDIIKIDKYTKKIQTPTLLLMNRSFDVIGKINRFDNWNISLVANGIDEISFEVHKYVNGKLNPVWNDLTDLKIVDVDRFGRFEISVDYTDNTETVKLVCGQSLEVELGQIGIYELHINDEDDISYENYKPTVFYNHDDEEHSLLHRVLADKAPHWSIGYVTPFIALDEEYQPESSSTFQRTYTVDGETIYDFLTGTVAEESNVIFVFDTINRKINCYSLCDCINQDTGEIVCYGIGEDTNVLISKNKLANEISISSNKDNVKNCFRIVGGDDVITDMVRAVNMTGSNYIYVFSDFQLNDMSEELRNKIKAYQEKISSKELQDEYYGENGIYTRLCNAYEDLLYYESSMMPNVEIKETTAQEQYELVKQQLINNHVGVYSFANYNNTYFSGVTNCIEEMANVYVDSRYEVSISKALSYTYKNGDTTGTWTGNIKVTNVGDETEYYPKTEEEINRTFSIAIEDDGDKLLYTKQKIEKALSKSSMLDIDFDVAEMTEEEMRDYFNLYSLNRLKSFAEGYNNCLSVLMQLGETTTTDIQNEIYSKYVTRFKVISNPPTSENPFPNPLGILEIRQKQVDDINTEIVLLTEEQKNFLEKNQLNLQEFLGDKLYKDFCKYRREDTYTNSNYISDGYSTSECLARAKELIDVATKEAKKACVLQRTVSTSLNNLFALPEFENLYDKFSLFNYIRVRTEDEILKLRLIGVEFNGDSVEEIQVTFSDQIESVDNKISDAQSIYQQMSSVATTFPSTALQAKQGANANNEIVDFYTNGLNATKTMISSDSNNIVTITNAGINAKRMDDEGYYGEKQLRIIGNGIYMTEDAWQTVSMAIGEIDVDGTKMYGIIAQAIIGQLILGNQLVIKNINGSTVIDKNGITIYDGQGTESENKVFFADDEGNLNLKGNVFASGGLIGGLHISKDSISCQIGIDYDKLPLDDMGRHYYDYNYTYKGVGDGKEYTAVIRSLYDEEVGAFQCYIYEDINGGLTLLDNFYQGHLDSLSGDEVILQRYFNLIENNFVYAYGTTIKYYHQKTTVTRDTVYITYCYTFNSKQDGSGDSFSLYKKDIPHAGISDNGCDIPVENIIKDITNSMDTTVGTYGGKTSLYIDQNGMSVGECAIFDIITNTSKLKNINCSLVPYIDSTYDVGSPYKRWKTLYSSTSSIVTSDKNKKYDITYDIDKYILLFDKLKPCSFKYKDGNSGRIHIGYIAQDVEDAMRELELEDVDFAGLCKDKVGESWIYSLRYDEFQGIYDAKIKQLEERLVKLENYILNNKESTDNE